jgi:hypothetical protein
MAKFVKGARVLPSGAGRTATWPKTPGTVTQTLSKDSVEVVWDGTHYGDEMKLEEIVPATGAAAKKPATEPTDLRLIQQTLDGVLGAERFDDQAAAAAGIRLYPATFKGRPVMVTIPED